MIDIHQTQQYANYLQKNGWITERNKGNYVFIKKLPLIGYIIKIQRPEFIDFENIKTLDDKYRPFKVVIEPKNEFDLENLKKKHFKLSNSPFIPTKTLRIDLTRGLTEILGKFKKDAKGFVRKTESLTINSSNVDNFRNVWKKSVNLKRYVPSKNNLKFLKKSFKNNCFFALSETKNAGAIFLIADKTAYYWQAFTNKKGRENKEQYKIVWEGIRWGMKKGAKIFDFEGIFDDRFPNKAWQGFTHFKKSFGGEVFQYPGCFTKYKFPFMFFL